MANHEIKHGILEIENPVECSIINRENRFVVNIEIEGSRYRAHTNNTGRLSQFLVQGKKGFCIPSPKTAKTDYKIFAVEDKGMGAIIDTQLQMRAFEKSVATGIIPWLNGYKIVKRNARIGNSLIDYLLTGNGKEILLEVKSAVFRDNNYAVYPDCPTERGRKHIRELTAHVQDGGKALILFIAGLPDVTGFRPSQSADPELYQLLVSAHNAGVVLKSIAMAYSPRQSCVSLLNPELPVNLI